MVRVGRVLIDAALYEPHSHHACVEVEILLCVAGNAGDVMNAANVLHRFSVDFLSPHNKAARHFCRAASTALLSF
jgi:hypothetical protein